MNKDKQNRKKSKQENRAKRLESFYTHLAQTLETTSKQLVWIFSINGILWIWCSYILAFMKRDTIAEQLSSNVCTVIIGQLGFYLISKTVENVFRYNDIFSKRKLKLSKDEVDILKQSSSSSDETVMSETPVSSDDTIYTSMEEEFTNERSYDSDTAEYVDPNCLD